MNWILKILLNGVALIAADRLIADVQIRDIETVIIAALILGIINTVIRPILIVLTIPLTIFSLGLFILVINAITFELTAYFVEGFEIYSFWGAFLGALVTSVVSWLLDGLLDKENK